VFLFVAESLPLLANQLRTLWEGDVFEIAAGVAVDSERDERVGCTLDLAFILDGRPLPRVLRVQGSAQLGAS